MDSSEIQIPVPWGIIAAKTWGTSSSPLVLSIHGWLDNASSFDPLIPLLPRCFYYVCIDLPGHGKSSPVETSLILHDMDYIIALKLVYDYFNRDKIIIIAHSMGGFLGLTFTQFYPKCVEKIVVLDVFHYFPRPPYFNFKIMLYYYNQRIKSLRSTTKKEPAFTKEDIIDKLIRGRLTPLSRKAAEILVDRGIQPAGDGKFRFTVAQNAKQIVLSTFPIDNTVDILRKFPIKCPHLLILSSSCSFMRFAFKKVDKEFKKNPNYEMHVVEGTHEVHIENPESVACLVNKFLIKHQNKL